MQALREIHNLTSDTLNIKIPPNIPYPKAEVIVLFLEDKIEPTSQTAPWKATRQCRKKLERRLCRAKRQLRYPLLLDFFVVFVFCFVSFV